MIKLLQWVVRIAGLVAILLGMSFWAGPGIAPVSVHMTVGGLVALALAILAVTALINRVRLPVAVVALLWAFATVAVGTVQDWWIGAGSHVLIEVIHLVLGVGAIGLAEMLAAALNRAQPV
jgi:uncharacterized membrane protein HdeD (DUF308 family)